MAVVAVERVRVLRASEASQSRQLVQAQQVLDSYEEQFVGGQRELIDLLTYGDPPQRPCPNCGYFYDVRQDRCPACAAAGGACWAVVGEKYGLLLFGTLPVEARPRASIAALLMLAGVVVMLLRFVPLPVRAAASALLILTAPLLLHGAAFGLRVLPVVQWGGIVVTILLAVYSIGLAIVVSIPLALARRSANPVLRAPAAILIELVRGVPLVVLLFVTVSVLPLLLGGQPIDKMWLVLTALTLHAATSLAEVWRGGLEAVPDGQMEGATALGLSRWNGFRLVVWPQARRIAMPPAIGTIIGAVKDTSLVLVIGIFDMLGAAKAALADMAWRAHALEIYLAVAAFYFVVCFALSVYAERLRTRPYHS